MIFKRLSFESKDCNKELKLECANFLARLASFGHVGFISDPLIISMFHNKTHDPKEQEKNLHYSEGQGDCIYYINVLQQTACLVVNPITVGNFAVLFNCTLVGGWYFRLYDGSDLKTYLLMRW